MSNDINRIKKYLIIIASGIFIGFLNGFFGGGGGMIAVPVLANILKFTTKESHASAIFIILPLCITSVITYYTLNTFDFSNGTFVCIGVMFGGIIGAFLLKHLNNKIIEFSFALIMVIAGIKLTLG